LKYLILIFCLLNPLALFSATENVLVQLFSWSWKDVANECEDYLGPKGFYGVQVSPPNEHAIVEGRPWYERYQPVSYKINSSSGDLNSFKSMVRRCRSSGVEIYVDVVLNHVAWFPKNGETARGIADSLYSKYHYPDYPNDSFFHKCRNGESDDIWDWNNRFELFNCNLANLPDLNTADRRVQNTLRSYLKKLKSLGVKGIRVDAAKHVAAKDLKEIYADIFDKEHIYQEVIDLDANGPVRSDEYFHLGKVTNFNYGQDLGRIFQHGNLAYLKSFGEPWAYTPTDKTVVFLDNHDTQRGHGPNQFLLTYKNGDLYTMARAFMLSWPYGQPILMSSYYFNDNNIGPPTRDLNKNICRDENWVCEHRNNLIAPLISLRKKLVSPHLSGWWTNNSNQIAFSREKKHLFVFNRNNYPIKKISNLNLEHGDYKDLNSNAILKVFNNEIHLHVDPNSFKIFSKL